MTPNVKGAVFGLTAFGVFAVHDAVVKWLGATYSPVQIVFFSVLFGFPLVTLMLIRDPEPAHLRPRRPGWTALRTASVAVTGLSAFYAFATLPLAQVYAILFAAPLLITVLSIPILGETVRLKRWAAVIVCLCGVLIVLRPGGTDLTAGHAAALVAAFGGALASIIVRKIGQEERSVVLLLYPLLVNFALMGAALPFVYQPMPAAHLGGLAGLAALAFTASALVIAAYRIGEAVIVAPMQYSQILWAVLFGALFFGERPDLWTAVGAAVIIASGLVILWRESDRTASANRPVLQSRSRFETGTVPRISLLQRALGRREPARD